MMRQQWLVFLPMTLATAGLAACASMVGEPDLKVRPIETKPAQASVPHDPLYESAVLAINDRDYGRALDYLQAAKAKDPGSVKILNALGVVYDKLGRFDLSARYYAQARTIEPDSKILAENMGYSRVLQRLINPGATVAVANLDLPALTAPAAPEQKPAILAATIPSTTAPEAKPLAVSSPVAQLLPLVPEKSDSATPPPAPRRIAAPALVPAERPLIDASLVSAPDLPVLPPDSRLVAVPASVFASAGRQVLTTATVPDLPLPPPDARQVAVPASVLASAGQRVLMTASLPDLPVPQPEARHVSAPASLFASQRIFLPDSMPELPLPPPEARRVAVSSAVFASSDRLSFTQSSMPSLPAESSAEAKAIIAPAAFAAPAKPVIAAPESLAAAELPPTVAPAPLHLTANMVGVPASIGTPSTEPSHIPATVATDLAAPVAERKKILAAVPAVPPVLVKPAAIRLPAVVKLAEPAPRPAIKAVRMTAVLPVARPGAPAAPAAHSAAAPAPFVAKLPEKRTEVAALQPKSAPPAKPSGIKAMFLALAALPAKFFTPASAKQAMPVVETAMKADAVRAASVKMTVAPVKTAAMESTAPMAPTPNESAKKVLTIGQPLRLLNASGKPSGTGTVLRRLATLGWTMRASEASAQPASVLYYSAQNLAAAKALQRTLPFPVRLKVDKANTSGMRLVIGRDYLAWKPRNAHIAALWQKSAVIASLQKPAIKGER